MEKALFGAGCFWGVEAAFRQVNGVIDVQVGYAGGTLAHPSYEQVCTGTTGHAEVAAITFDPEHLCYTDLLTVFWTIHNPTTLNRQGVDVGTQYRSVIFYYSPAQQQQAEASKAAARAQFAQPIVTHIEPAPTFYRAEAYHQNYLAKK